MIRSEVLNATTVCQNFPNINVEKLISRDNLLDTIERIFDSETQIVVIEGEEGIGKTSSLAQFAKRHNNTCISLFVLPTSHWGYDLELIRFDLCNQLQWILRQEELDTENIESVNNSLLRGQITKLMRKAKRENRQYFFIIDGLEDIPESDIQVRKLILELLPIGLPNIKVVLSGNYKIIRNELSKALIKPFQLPPFSLEETKKFLSDLQFDEETQTELHKTFRGNPLKLTTVKRLLQLDSSITIEHLVTDKGNSLSLLDVEWNSASIDDETRLFIAILAFSRSSHTVQSLANTAKADVNYVLDRLAKLSFLQIDSNDQDVSFISGLFRKYVTSKLKTLERSVYDLLIDNLRGQKESYGVQSSLPVYMHKAGKYEELLQLLSPDYFDYIIANSNSYLPIQAQVNIGLEASLESNRNGEAIRFSIHQSVLSHLSLVNPWESEIEARMAVGDYTSAISLAQTAQLKEDRLHLLALIAQEYHKQNREPESEIVSQIEQLVNQLDEVKLGERAIEIASKLMYVNPATALRLIERADESKDDPNALDWAYFRLSLAAVDSANPEFNHIAEDLTLKINNPKTRSLAIATTFIVKDYPALTVINEARKLESVGLQLRMLRAWLLRNREKLDAIQVVEYALNVLVKTTDYVPMMQDYREIAAPLPYLKDKEKALNLVQKFDGQKGTLEYLGPTRDYVRLQMLLAETEMKFDIVIARNRLIDIYIYVQEIADLSVHSECIARMLSGVTRFDKENSVGLGLRENLEADLNQAIKRLLVETSQHELSVIDTIKALARYRFADALYLALKLNIEERRDEALVELIGSISRMPMELINFENLLVALDKIVNIDDKDRALINIVTELSTESCISVEVNTTKLLPLLQLCSGIRSPKQRCYACCLAVKLLLSFKQQEHASLIQHLLKIQLGAWSSIDKQWEKIDVGFQIGGILAKQKPDTAKEYIKSAEDLSNQIKMNTDGAAQTYLLCTLLTIRAYKGLITSGINSDRDLDRIAELIEFVPSQVERASLWCEVALQFYVSKLREKCREIVSERIRPILANIKEENISEYEYLVSLVAPSLYCAHSSSAKRILADLPRTLRDRAYTKVIRFILTKCSRFDPFNPSRNKIYLVDYEELIDICEILDLVDVDSTIVQVMEHISRTLKRSGHLTRQQKAEVIDHLRSISTKFPLRRHIQHDGYRILSEAILADAENIRDHSFWQQIFDKASAVPNISDRSFVLAQVAVLAPNKFDELKRKIVKAASEATEQIPSLIDKIERYENLANIFAVSNQVVSQEYLKSAMKNTLISKDLDAASIQRKIIDAAYVIDQKFASSLAALLENDPARKSAYLKIKDQLEQLDIKSKIANQEELEQPNKKDYSQMAWSLLGSMNGGQLSARYEVAYFIPYLRFAAETPLDKSYPVYAFMLENFIQRYSDTDQARTILRQTFEAILVGNEVVRRSYRPSNDQIKYSRTSQTQILQDEYLGLLVRPGERSKAIKWLRTWLEENLEDHLIICDQFFGPSDLDLLKLIQTIRSDCHIHVLTSWKHHTQENIPDPWDDYYRDQWRNNISDIQTPPVSDIVIVGVEPTKKSPIHDRWWLTSNGGLRLGTSFNGIGFDSDSEISVLTNTDAEEKRKEVNQYLSQSVRTQNGNRLFYRLVTF